VSRKTAVQASPRANLNICTTCGKPSVGGWIVADGGGVAQREVRAWCAEHRPEPQPADGESASAEVCE
jgi:hypothetical protein